MEISKGIKTRNLLLELKNTLIISDLHIGIEEALTKQGILIPKFHFKDTIKQLEKDLKKVKTIIINGDLKHEFGRISDQEWRETLKVLDLLSKYCEKIILIKGNHDNILGPIAKKRKLEIVDYYKIDDIYICHGNSIPKDLKGVKTIIISHEHPAIRLREKTKVEKFKCFLKGKYKGKNLIVQPSFNPIIEGTDVLKGKMLSPFLKQSLNNFNVWIVADKVYDFGKLKNLK
ncbi:metallophosphoesterase [Nanoarchaeota archaeon]